MVSSGAIMPARAPASIDMLHTVMRSSMVSARIAAPRYSSTWPVPPSTPICADDREDQVLGGDAAARSAPSTLIAKVFGSPLQQALGREHMSDLGGADAEGERAEGAMGAGVAVAADDGLARLRQAELRADHVHDAALLAAAAEQLDAELGAVALQLRDLPGAPRST